MPSGPTERTPSPGILDALLALGAGLIGTLSDRVQLLAVELNEEKIRLLQNLALGTACAFLAGMAVIMGSVSLVYAFWESARLMVLLGLTLAYLIGAIVLLLVIRRRLATQPRPFQATLEELAADRTCLHRES